MTTTGVSGGCKKPEYKNNKGKRLCNGRCCVQRERTRGLGHRCSAKMTQWTCLYNYQNKGCSSSVQCSSRLHLSARESPDALHIPHSEISQGGLWNSSNVDSGWQHYCCTDSLSVCPTLVWIRMRKNDHVRSLKIRIEQNRTESLLSMQEK